MAPTNPIEKKKPQKGSISYKLNMSNDHVNNSTLAINLAWGFTNGFAIGLKIMAISMLFIPSLYFFDFLNIYFECIKWYRCMF
jgi:hypothetical protein